MNHGLFLFFFLTRVIKVTKDLSKKHDNNYKSIQWVCLYRGAQGIIGPDGELGDVGKQGPIGEKGQKGKKFLMNIYVVVSYMHHWSRWQR